MSVTARLIGGPRIELVMIDEPWLTLRVPLVRGYRAYSFLEVAPDGAFVYLYTGRVVVA